MKFYLILFLHVLTAFWKFSANLMAPPCGKSILKLALPSQPPVKRIYNTDAIEKIYIIARMDQNLTRHRQLPIQISINFKRSIVIKK